ncbi:ectonucleotide pyrophosphatase/phosphodiesterase family member 5-like isoform X1 [Homalodisca vitripennis]|uniref:ectonucleotide pyrophosphatase/phosphodiesterase family member 5-like isoform X1 n=1 Tax=Homalodisca vitripennis TaxID=197043 RepID=UPI001EEC5168|nr:ectonucleotide pyrophosphatase/phosphodiesterase family member 5-like isoform X1 [Homalodisca vitripennis]
MFQLKLFFYTFFVTFLFKPIISDNNNTLLIIVSFDGFRYDYIERNLTDNIVNLKSNSSFAPYMNSVFPTKTFPNHFSIATGLYTEVHGVLDNKVYDSSNNKSLGYGYELFHYNDDIVPLWILNERGGGGRRSGCSMWPGSNFEYQGTLPSHFQLYNSSVPWEDRVDTVFGWFKHPDTPINLAMVYFEQPDDICHKFGPNSPEINTEIARVDRIVQYMMQKAEETNLLNKLNFVFLSDHGGQAIEVPGNLINLDSYINKTWYIRDGVPPSLQIYPVKGKEIDVLKTLRAARNEKGANFTAYTQEQMLDRWHYRHCKRTPPILLLADLGYLFLPAENEKQYKITTSEIGTHGYDPVFSTMRAFFMATGPMFKRNFKIDPFENINIYPLAAHMLGLPLPLIAPNGTLSTLQDILVTKTSAADENATTYIVAVIVMIIACIATLLGWLFLRNYLQHKEKLRKSSIASYKILNQGTDEERLYEVRDTQSSDCDDDCDSPT